MNKYLVLSFTAWLAAVTVGLGGIIDLWSVTASPLARLTVLAVEAAILCVLFINSLLILRWTYRNSAKRIHHSIAWLCFLSLCLCIGGDIVNFNLPQTYYRHGDIVKHDYLADSVLFFGPGYTLLLAAVLLSAKHLGGAGATWVLGMLGAALLLGGMSFFSIYIPGSGAYVAGITGSYSILITAVGISGLLLLAPYHVLQAPLSIWAICIGLALAALADAVIGTFWIYGNAGQGFFPLVRDANWILYISSQCLVILLPKAMVDIHHNRHPSLLTNSRQHQAR